MDGPVEFYHENGQLQGKGAGNMGEKCGEWIEDGETVPLPPPVSKTAPSPIRGVRPHAAIQHCSARDALRDELAGWS